MAFYQDLESNKRDIQVCVALAEEEETVKDQPPMLHPAGCCGSLLHLDIHRDKSPFQTSAHYWGRVPPCALCFSPDPEHFLHLGKWFMEENHTLLIQSKTDTRKAPGALGLEKEVKRGGRGGEAARPAHESLWHSWLSQDS